MNVDPGPPSEGLCRCCGEQRTLRRSHIISKLAYRRLKRFDGVKRLVDETAAPVQDGPTRYLLCDQCEQRLGQWEREFNERLLTPYYKAPRFQVAYGDWLSRFAAANLWRVLVTLRADSEISEALTAATMAAERAWHELIAANAPTCGKHDIHVVLIDDRPEWAAYAEGVIEYNIIADSTCADAYLVTKLPGLAFIGVLCERNGRAWSGTMLSPAGGFLDASVACSWPALVGRYFQNRISAANEATRVEWS
jgi:hypothetical protein